MELPEANMESEEKLFTGFHHETVLSIAPEIIEAVKTGKIHRFFVIAGCDAPGKGENTIVSLRHHFLQKLLF
ncbi:hypothetical protein GCM10020331_064310 [Ectobacillus funiculus]